MNLEFYQSPKMISNVFFLSITFNGLQKLVTVSHLIKFFNDILSLYELGVLPIAKEDT
jgi:hypothetical protein